MRCYIAMAALLVAAPLSVPNAHAEVLYSFSSTFPNMSWSFTEPSIITTDTTVAAANLSSLHNPVGCSMASVSIQSPTVVNFSVGTNFTAVCNGGLGGSVGFDDGPINHLGTYSPNNPDIHATLVVSSTTIPEPSSMLLLGTGAVAFFRPIRRKLLAHGKQYTREAINGQNPQEE